MSAVIRSRYVATWHGGASYGAPWADDAEMFDSIEQAADAMRERRDHGYTYPQTFRYVFRDESRDLTPNAHEDGSGHVDLYRGPFADADTLREYLERDAVPDVRLVFGPRGGITRT